MVFADGVDVETDLVGEHDFLEQIAHPLLLADEMAGVRIGEAVAEGGDAQFHHPQSSVEHDKGRGKK